MAVGTFRGIVGVGTRVGVAEALGACATVGVTGSVAFEKTVGSRIHVGAGVAVACACVAVGAVVGTSVEEQDAVSTSAEAANKSAHMLCLCMPPVYGGSQ